MKFLVEIELDSLEHARTDMDTVFDVLREKVMAIEFVDPEGGQWQVTYVREEW